MISIEGLDQASPPSAATGHRELRILHQVALALDHAHRRGVLHQDLKPATVHLETGDHVKVVDFGIARLASAAARLGPAERFQPAEGYLTPEQALGLPPDARTDIFCFGSLAYELLTGRPAFAGTTAAELLRQTLEAEPPWLGDAWPQAPPALAALVGRCLERHPGDRYPTLEPILEELTTLLAEEREEVTRHAVEPAGSEESGEFSLDDTMAIPPDLVHAPGDAGELADLTIDVGEVNQAQETRSSGGALFGDATASTTQPITFKRAEATAPPGAEPPRAEPAPPPPTTGLGAGGAIAPPPPAPAPARAATAPARAKPRGGGPPWRLLGILGGTMVVAVVALGLFFVQQAPAPAPLAAPEPAVAAPAASPVQAEGWLVVRALPWGRLTALTGPSGNRLALPAEASTPVALRLPAGHYAATLDRGDGGESLRCEAEVTAGSRADCTVSFESIASDDYFAEAGWWR